MTFTDDCPEGCGSPAHPGPCRPDPGACNRWTGNGYCGAEARQFVVGYRCPAHTPAALAGMPEPPPGPGVPLYRRQHLAHAIEAMPEPITAAQLAAVSRAAGWSGNRNTARKDAGHLVADGLIIPVSTAGNTAYRRITKDDSCASTSAAAA